MSVVISTKKRVLYVIELTETEEGGLELVDPSWCPEEGTPRRKIRSPPVISPTASTTSLYSGGSSSIDWTTTGTTLDMQGTRVTRTQYGFRTLQESSAKMCLKVTGYPLPDITWYKDDELLHEDDRRTFYSDEDGFFALTIDPVQVDDTGRYTCMATNEYGQASTSAFFRVLKVEKEPAAPAFVTPLRDLEVKEGEVASFECEVEGWPEPELLWLVDDQPLRPSHDFRLEYDGLSAKLEIRDVQPEDTGVYAVRIKNEYGAAESNAKLTVQPDPDKNHVAPEFQAVIEDIECDEGDTVKFKAVLTGDPYPDVMWLVNGIPLSESDKIKFICEDGICIVTINDVSRHFDGTITCQGTNRLGTKSCDARLKVRIPQAPPQFDRPLEDVKVMCGNSFTLECNVSGYPEPDVKFFLNGKLLVSGENGVVITCRENINYRIMVTYADVDKHSGDVLCTAVNKLGQAECRARIVVDVPDEESRSAPSFLKDLEDQTVKFGERAVFETTTAGNPNPEVTWFVNGKQLSDGDHGVRIETISNTEHRLVLDSTLFAGTVMCRAQNVVGRFETKATLTVEEPEKPKKAPTFVEKLCDTSSVEESTVILEVRVEAQPEAKLKWILNDVELQESENVKIREFAGSWKLELHNVRLDQSGKIKCVAENSEGSAETSAQLMVTRKSCQPKFDRRPGNVVAQRGSTVKFEAHADAVPEPEYSWSIDGRKVRDYTSGSKVEFVNGVSILTIDTSIISSSTISVIAENSQGVDETGARLTVEERPAETAIEGEERPLESPIPDLVEQAGEEEGEISVATEGGEFKAILKEEIIVHEITKVEDKPTVTEVEMKPPKIVQPITDQIVPKGEEARFETVIEAAETVEWYSNGQKLENIMPGIVITADDNFHFRLTIDSTQYAGTILVKAVNTAGTIEENAQLKFTEKVPTGLLPEFTKKLENVKLEVGQTLVLEVSTTQSVPITWTLNGKVLQDGVDRVSIINRETVSILEIRDISTSHDGTVTAMARNEVGEVTTVSRVIVEEKTEAAKIVEGPTSVSVKETEDVMFTVKAVGYPAPTIEWSLNDIPILPVTGHISIESADGRHSLKIERIQLKEAGNLTVTARNVYGKDSKTASVTVTPVTNAPIFKVRLADQVVKEGEPIRWDVSLEKPDNLVKLSWYLNDRPLVDNENVKIVDHGDGSYHLTIAKAILDMTGSITCRAALETGESSECRASIEVKPSPKPPEFTKRIQDHITFVDESVKFSAVVEGRPMPEVTWYLNDKQIISSDDIRVKYEESTGKTSIRIFKPKKEDSGKVTLKVKNDSGEAECSAQLIVEARTEPPRFLVDLVSRQVKEGESAKFYVEVVGTPSPDVNWFLNDNAIISSSAIEVIDDGNKHTLIFNSVDLGDGGEVSCEAKNSVGLKKQFATLKVREVGEAPTFSKNLEDRLVAEGEEIVMETKLTRVKPKPEIVWLRDGKPITDSRFVTSEDKDGVHRLTISKAEMRDQCRITFRAENKFGCADSSASIGVTKKRPEAKPKFLSDIAPLTVTEGDTLEAKVLISGDPTPFVKWYINDQLVVSTEDTEIKSENGVFSLKIHGCTRDMTGTIKCVAYNKAGEATTKGSLTVVAPIPVEFETTLCDATCREGDTLKLKAVLLGEPTPVVSWYINSKKLEESQNIKIDSSEGTYTVTIRNITCDYSGKVLCEAVNEFGTATSEAMLLVLPRGEPPDFIEWLSNVKARQGSRVTHKVVFTGDPRPKLTWFINGAVVTEDENISIVTDNTTSTLTIKSFNPDKHVGEIICKAENDAGEVSCTASMGRYTSDMFSESESEIMGEEVVDFEETFEEIIERTETKVTTEISRTPTPINAPKFITKLKDLKVSRGKQAIFECVVPDTKGIVCKWLKDGKEVQLITRIRVQTRTIEGFTTNELIIENVGDEDAGKYTVVIENDSGKATCEANLTVIESLVKPAARQPEFVISLQDKTPKASEKVVLECKVTGEPEPTIRWYHEEKVVIEEERRVRIESEGGVQRLTIHACDIDDQGKYKCVAENIAGRSETSCSVDVQAEAPKFMHHIVDKELEVGDRLSLECSVKGIPQPVVQFFTETERIVSDEHISVEHDITNTHWRIVIEKTTEKDFRRYRAVARNSAGQTESVAEVRRKPKADVYRFDMGLKKTTVRKGDTLTLIVKISGHPKPTVKWSKDGRAIREDGSRVTATVEEDGTFILTIKNADIGDVGKYSAEIVESEKKETTTAEVFVIESIDQPYFKQCLSEVTIKERETSQLKVTVVSQQQPIVKWFKDGTAVNVDNIHYISKTEEDGSHVLIIKDARIEDAGMYSCKASTPSGECETAAKVTIEEVLILPEFTQKLQALTVKEGTTSQLKVTVIGKPIPIVEWCKDGQPVITDKDHTVTKDEEHGIYILTIKNANNEDAGIYSCKATNKGGIAEVAATFTVVQDIAAPEFTEKLHPIKATENETVELKVTVMGQPQPEVEWLKDGVPINIDNTHIIEKKDENGAHVLIVKNVEMKDAGIYACRATNVGGYSEVQTNFYVVEEVRTTFIATKKVIAPMFTQKLEPVTINENETVELRVTVMGEPEPDVTWLKDNVPLVVDSTHIISRMEGNGVYSLTIKEAQKTDAGMYTCRATNAGGSAEIRISFAVIQETKAPSFTEKLYPIITTEHENVELKVSVSGTPQPEITWLKDGSPISIDNIHIIERKDENGRRVLIIKDVQKADAGIYSCKAVNAGGSAEVRTSFAVEEFTKLPQFVNVPGGISVVENQTAEITVTIVGEPQPVVTWLKDGKPVSIDNVHTISKKDDKGNYSLVIKEARKNDSGTYTCQATSESGTTKTEIKFIVEIMAKPPQFTQRIENLRIKEQETAEITVTVVGTPTPQVEWFKDGARIVPDNTHVITKHDEIDKFVLIINDALTVDEGRYVCKATNSAGTSEMTVNISVEKSKEPPLFKQGLRDTQVLESEAVELSVIVTGSPSPTIEWLKDGVPINIDNVHIIEKKEEIGTYTLIIKEATAKDEGTYSCKATNAAGTTESVAKVGVTATVMAPEFTQKEEDIRITEHSTTEIAVILMGTPEAQVEWFKDGVPVTIDETHLISKKEEDGKFILVIQNARTEDAGTYTCRATNAAGASEMKINITIEKSEGVPEFVEKLTNVEVLERQTAELSVTVAGSPISVEWFKNGVPVNIDNIHVIEKKEESGTYTLIIKEATAKDEGTYSCKATNALGTTESVAKFAVTTITVAPEFTQKEEDIRITEHSTTEIAVTLMGAPEAQVEWFKDGVPLTVDETHLISKKEEDGKFILVIQNARTEDAGTYTCRATNAAGASEMKINITIEKSEGVPEFVEKLKNVEVLERQTAELSVTVAGSPISVEWFKDGVPVNIDNVHVIEKKEECGNYTLVIKEATRKDEGTYSCKATNALGTTESVAKFAVTTTTVTPEFTQKEEDIRVTEHSTTEIAVTLMGAPEAQVEWFKDGVPVTIDETHLISKKEEDGKFILVIQNARTEDAGTYTCRATSESGTSEVKVNVTVEKAEVVPEFVEKLTNVEVLERQTAELSVTVAGSPISVEWFKDGVPVSIDNVHIMEKKGESGTYTLIINETTAKDEGTYSCKATNAMGTAESMATVAVTTVIVAPEFSEKVENIEVTEHTSTEISVTVMGTPTVQVEWLKDGIPVSVDETRMITRKEEGGKFTLIIRDVEVKDAGVYTCRATNVGGKAEVEVSLAVEKIEQRPQFVEKLKHVETAEHETAELTVTVTGTPAPVVLWLRDEVPISIDNTHFIERRQESGTFTLVINDVTVKDAGTYTCKATNAVGTSESEAKLAVVTTVMAPEFSGKLEDVLAAETETTEISVTVVGQPQPKIEWFKDGQKVIIDNVHLFEKEYEGGVHTLIIKECRTTDAGHYTCKATNAGGIATIETNIAITSTMKAPEFGDSLKIVSVAEKETGQITVTVAGSPAPTVEWFKDSQPVVIDKTHFIKKDEENGIHTLIIKEATVKDAGIYSCVASNLAGSAEIATKFAVESKLTAPEFTDLLGDVNIEEYETAHLTASVIGMPQPEVKWFKDGFPVNIDNVRIIARQDDSGHCTLVIKQSRLEDTGTYTCRATNAAGTEESSAIFAVEEVLEMPQFTSELTDVSVRASESATLSVTATGKPEPNVVWLKDSQPINIDNLHVLSKKDDQGRYTLVIKNASIEDAGIYSCKAVNKAGEVETQAHFGVAEEFFQPEFTEKLTEFNAIEGEEVRLSCTVVGKPEPQVKWLKDNVEISIDNEHVIVKKDESGHHTLEISCVSREDAGLYTCEAENVVGTDSTQAELKFPKYGFEKLKAQEVKPMFEEPLQTAIVKEGDSVSLTCKVNKEADATIQWYRNDEPVKPDSNLIVEQLDDGYLKLTIQDARPEDVGVYRCEAVNISGKTATTAKVDLKYAKDEKLTVVEEVPLLFEMPIADVIAKIGERVELECKLLKEVDGMKITWSKDGSSIPSGVTTESYSNGLQKLIITDVQPEHVGNYRCTASNLATSIWTEGKLTVTGMPAKAEETAGEKPPEFVELLRSCTVTENNDAILRCRVEGVPKPIVKWMKDGEEVVTSERLKVEYLEDGTATLTIKNAKVSESGEYRCDATNSLGSAWTVAPLCVATEGALPTEGEAPDFVEPIRPVTVSEGEVAALEGKITGIPTPEVKWYRGDEELKSNEKISIECRGDGTQRLVVKNATLSDMGEYRCAASNEYGDVWCDVTLTVQVPSTVEEEVLSEAAPTFLKPLEEATANVGEEVALECKIVGQPMPEIKWYKDKQEITADNIHFKKETFPDGTARLIIKSAVKADAGEFRCEAQNPSGTARTEARLQVLYVDEVGVESEVCPEFIEDLKMVTANVGQQAVFECRHVHLA
ncbi:hypothetical protein AB6A40_001973 [Gnathostoma spinigerum]|uniref:Ig-like domain-containing protein n=1 Tax=Gnathostoma spinigerum TaxID=75299 RepID=A0ABD6EAU7_9BILA